jgi:hypothetical protein
VVTRKGTPLFFTRRVRLRRSTTSGYSSKTKTDPKSLGIGCGALLLLFLLCGSCLPDAEKAEPEGGVQPLLQSVDTAEPSESTVPATEPATEPAATATDEPTATAEPTEVLPTDVPTEVPTIAPTAAPPTAVPATEVPAPTDPPAPAAAEPAAPASGSVPDLADAPPASAPWLPCAKGQIKGNQNSLKFHVPGGSHYQRTYRNVWCFNSSAEAQAAGYVQSQN